MAGPTVRIPVRVIVNGEGIAIRTFKLDDDGDAVFEETCPACGRPAENSRPIREPLTTISAMRSIAYMLNSAEGRKVAKGDDGAQVYRLMAHLADARKRKAPVVRLPQGVFEWLGRVFERSIPPTKAAKEDGYEPQTIGETLWGVNAWLVWKQLTVHGLEPIPFEEMWEEGDLAPDGTPAEDAARLLVPASLGDPA